MIKNLFYIVLLVLSGGAFATKITINNVDNTPLAQAVVWLTAEGARSSDMQPEVTYAMSQKERQFTPRILVVPQNAKVEFPNADSIMHHVYSFSKAKTFELKLYKEQPKAPIVFDQTGVVELGCNIHDWMLGYIVVVDSPLFAITNAQGEVDIPAAAGSYTMSVWHSGFSDISQVERQAVVLADASLSYTVKQQILPQVDFATDEFDDY